MCATRVPVKARAVFTFVDDRCNENLDINGLVIYTQHTVLLTAIMSR